MLRLRFLGWSYAGIENFVAGIEQGMVFVGVLLAVVFAEYSFVYGVLAALAFVLFRLMSAVFDMRLVKEILTNEITEYVEREIGQFYGADLSATVFKLKNELATAIKGQSEAMVGAVKKLGTDVSAALTLSMEEMSRAVTASLTGAEAYAESIKQPLADWSASITAAERLQSKINTSVKGMDTAGSKFGAALEILDTTLKEHQNRMAQLSAAEKEQMAALVNAAAELNAANAAAAKQNEGVTRSLNYIEKNQEILERSLHEYETSLENITERLGDGLSSMVGYQLQNSYSTLNDNLQNNLAKITGLNSELLTRLQDLFSQVLHQSRGEMKAIIQLKEQLELSLETLEENRGGENKGI
jgi:chromosome segregation ATPase